MIRRTFKARVPRNVIINTTYKVWWNLNYTSIQYHSLLTLREQIVINHLNKLSTGRENLVIGNTHQIYKSNVTLNINIGYQPLLLNMVITNKYQPKTSWQTNTKFVNCFNRATFQFLVNIKNSVKQYNSFLETTIYNSIKTNTVLTTNQSNFFYQVNNFTTIREWRLNKTLKLFKWYNIKSARWYSERERFMRVLANRNPNLKHFQLVFNITRLKI